MLTHASRYRPTLPPFFYRAVTALRGCQGAVCALSHGSIALVLLLPACIPEMDVPPFAHNVPLRIEAGQCVGAECECSARHDCSLDSLCINVESSRAECMERCENEPCSQAGDICVPVDLGGTFARVCYPAAEEAEFRGTVGAVIGACTPCDESGNCLNPNAFCNRVGNDAWCMESCFVDSDCPYTHYCAETDAASGEGLCVPGYGVCEGCMDWDGDGAGIGLACRARDCDEFDPTRYFGATDIAGNGVDEDCNGEIDDQYYVDTATFGVESPNLSHVEAAWTGRREIESTSEILLPPSP